MTGCGLVTVRKFRTEAHTGTYARAKRLKDVRPVHIGDAWSNRVRLPGQDAGATSRRYMAAIDIPSSRGGDLRAQTARRHTRNRQQVTRRRALEDVSKNLNVRVRVRGPVCRILADQR